MELIAASRIVRAQQAIAAARPYVAKMAEVGRPSGRQPPDARQPPPWFRDAEAVQKVAIIVITADRGLPADTTRRSSGPRNGSSGSTGRQGARCSWSSLVVRARATSANRKQPITASVTGVSDRPGYEDARRVVAAVMAPFEAAELDQIDLVYNPLRLARIPGGHGAPTDPHGPGRRRRASGGRRRACGLRPRRGRLGCRWPQDRLRVRTGTRPRFLIGSCPGGWNPRSWPPCSTRPPPSTPPASGP